MSLYKLYYAQHENCNRKLYSPVLSCMHHCKITVAKIRFL